VSTIAVCETPLETSPVNLSPVPPPRVPLPLIFTGVGVGVGLGTLGGTLRAARDETRATEGGRKGGREIINIGFFAGRRGARSRAFTAAYDYKCRAERSVSVALPAFTRRGRREPGIIR
jgi:hypothetical protein